MDPVIKREILLDNYQNPANRGLVEDESYMSTVEARSSFTSEVSGDKSDTAETDETDNKMIPIIENKSNFLNLIFNTF